MARCGIVEYSERVASGLARWEPCRGIGEIEHFLADGVHNADAFSRIIERADERADAGDPVAVAQVECSGVFYHAESRAGRQYDTSSERVIQPVGEAAALQGERCGADIVQFDVF